jgi:hypothetical protein
MHETAKNLLRINQGFLLLIAFATFMYYCLLRFSVPMLPVPQRVQFSFPGTVMSSQLSISQSSISNLLTRWNSLVLWVIRVKLFVTAIAAISKSYAPIGVPNISS